MNRHPDMLAALTLLVVVLGLFAPVIVQPGGLVYPPHGDFTDLTITHWPNIAFAVESLRATGQMPFWRPTIMSGAPFAANPLSGLFYFPHVVFLALPLAIGFNVLFIAHVWLTGCGAYALLRAWQVERLAAFVGALAWMATPKLFAHAGAGHVSMVEAVAWLPLAIWMAQRVMEFRRVMDGLWLGAVLAVQFLADPRISFYTVVLVALYIVFWLGASFSNRQDTKTNSILLRLSWHLGLAISGLAAALAFAVLSAALWLPFRELVTQSNRSALTLAEAGEWSLPLRQVVGLFLADWGGSHEWMVYIGILPLALAAFAACRALRRDTAGSARREHSPIITLWLLVCLVASALFSLGTNGPLFPTLFRFVPGLSLLRVPPRAWFIVAFATACLCAFGIEAMMREERRDKPPGWLMLAGVAVSAFALMFGLGGFGLLMSNPQAASAQMAMLHLALVAPASVAVVLLRAHGRIGAREFAIGSAAVIAATLAPVDLSLYRVVPEAQAFADRVGVAGWLAAQGQPGTFRVYSPSYSVPQQVAQRAGLELADGVDPMQLASYARLMQVATGARASDYSVTIPAFPSGSDVRTALRDVTPDAQLLGRLNVRYVVAEFPIYAQGLVERARLGPTWVYENLFAMPRAFVREGEEAHVVVSMPDRVVVAADGPGLLTLSQVNYPGWRAKVDGHSASIETVDSALMGVQLDSGHHVVEFTFEPQMVRFGMMVSVVGWGGLLIGWIADWLRRRA